MKILVLNRIRIGMRSWTTQRRCDRKQRAAYLRAVVLKGINGKGKLCLAWSEAASPYLDAETESKQNQKRKAIENVGEASVMPF